MDHATGAMGALLSKLGMLLKDEYDLQKSVKGGIKFLIAELESIQVALEKVSSYPADQVDKQERLWAKYVRDMSYDIEDTLDTFLVRIDGYNTNKPKSQSINGFINRSLNSLANIKIRRRIAGNIKAIKERVKEVKERRDSYNVNSITVKANVVSVDPRLGALYKEATELVGIEKARDELTKMLSEGDGDMSKRSLRIISIVGFGGLGKTTLAKALCNSSSIVFTCRVIVSVGQNPDLKKVLKDILLELDSENFKEIRNGIRDEKELIDLLRGYLDNKRYLIVVDDIWDIRTWDILKLALVENNRGSRVIITTRKVEVGTEAGVVYKIQPLSHDQSRKLFCLKIFGGEDKCKDYVLGEVPNKILKKCGGVPLAIITMASLLAGKPREEWFEVYNSIGFMHEDNRHVENTMMILSFSYYDMPCHLRTCLLYLSVFPEDCIIYKDPLIWMWIAEGFVPEIQGIGLFDLGERYFYDLINRSMIQAEENGYYCLVGCRLHDMVLGLIRSLSREENFVTLFDTENVKLSQWNVRRLCYQHRGAKDNPMVDLDVTRVRSFIVRSCNITKMFPLSSFKILRVLALEGCDLREGNPLTHLGHLLHLRYLSLNNTPILEIPEEIGDLKFLQTLDLEGTKVTELPLSIVRLTQLVRLCGSYRETRILVDGIIGKLTSLEELYIEGGSWEESSNKTVRRFVRELGKLTQLRVLDTTFSADESVKEDLLETLGNLHKLRDLKIICYGALRAVDRIWTCEEDPDILLPRHLRRLNIWGIRFSHLPTCINSALLPNLSVLRINIRSMEFQDMRILGQLPKLISLSIATDSNIVLYGGDGLFQKLRYCGLDNTWWCDSGGTIEFRSRSYGAQLLPNLERLYLAVCVQAVKSIMVRHGQEISCFLPTFMGLHNIPSLKIFRARIDCTNATWRDVCETKNTLKDTVASLPNHPTVWIKTWDCTEDDMISDDEDQQNSAHSCRVFEFHVHVRELCDMCYAFDFANLWNFPTLEKVIAHINCGDATIDEVEMAEAALRLAVDNHPSTPTLEMERYCEDTMKLVSGQHKQPAEHDATTSDGKHDDSEAVATPAPTEDGGSEAITTDVC